jgi:hypothetical protein
VAWLNAFNAIQGGSMPLDFQSRRGAAYDAASGITIPEPRTLPMTMPDGSPGTEYQYAFYQNGRRIGGLGVWGHTTTVTIGGRDVTLFGHWSMTWFRPWHTTR